MRFWRYLAFRTFISILLIGVMVFVPLTILILNENRRNLEYQILSSARQTNSLIINTTRYSMLKNDRKAIKMTVRSLKKVPEIDLLRIYSKENISFSTEKDDVGREVDKKSEQCIVCHRSEEALVEIPDKEALQIYSTSEGHRYVVKTDPIFNSRSCSLTDCHPSPSEQKVLGMLETRMSLDEVDEQIAESRNHMIVLAFAAILVIVVFAAVFIWLFVHKRVRVLTEASMRIGSGDLEHRVNIKGKDELGILSESFNDMVEKIQAQTRKNEDLLDNIVKAIQVFTDTTTELYQITSKQSAGTTQQVSTIQQVLTSSQEFSSTSQQIEESAASVNESAEQAYRTCNLGTEYINTSASEMDRINEQVDKVKNHIVNLSAQATRIGGVIGIIEEISEQTELLALNAAIEAAGAGEAGKRFDAVAAEVRRLAYRSLDSTKTVKEMVASIQNSTNETVMAGEEEDKVVDSGIQSVKQLVDFFDEIIASVESTRASASEITISTQQQSSASEQMVNAVKEVEEVARQIEGGIKEIESLMGELKSMGDQLQALISEGEEALSRQNESDAYV